MGMGKNTRLREWLNQTASLRVLLVSTRQAFGRTLRGLFPEFAIYNEPNAMQSNKLICQVHKLTQGMIRCSSFQPFDVVVIDEVRSVVRNMTCVTTNGAHIGTNAELLRSLMKQAKSTILLDADLEYDGAVQSLVLSVFHPCHVLVERYHTVKLPRTLLCYRGADAWRSHLMGDVGHGSRVVICVIMTSSCQTSQKTIRLVPDNHKAFIMLHNRR